MAFFGGAFFGSGFFGAFGTSPQAGAPKKSKKRWWKVGDKLVRTTRDQVEAIWQEILAGQPVAQAVQEVESKPAPKVRAKPVDVVLPDIPPLQFTAFDWAPYYAAYVQQKDMEAADALVSAIRKRLAEEEDDMEVLKLVQDYERGLVSRFLRIL